MSMPDRLPPCPRPRWARWLPEHADLPPQHAPATPDLRYRRAVAKLAEIVQWKPEDQIAEVRRILTD